MNRSGILVRPRPILALKTKAGTFITDENGRVSLDERIGQFQQILNIWLSMGAYRLNGHKKPHAF